MEPATNLDARRCVALIATVSRSSALGPTPSSAFDDVATIISVNHICASHDEEGGRSVVGARLNTRALRRPPARGRRTHRHRTITRDARYDTPPGREEEEAAMPLSTDSGCGHGQPTTGDLERLLTIHDVAEWIGVSVSTLYQRSSRHEGPNRLKIGNVLRYKRCCVAAWIDEQVVRSQDDPQ